MWVYDTVEYILYIQYIIAPPKNIAAATIFKARMIYIPWK